MQQIWPEHREVSLLEAYRTVDSNSNSFLRLNIVASLDGAISFQGHTRELSSDIDRKCFKVMRSLADVLLVGSSTARVENYKPIVFDQEVISERKSRDQSSELPIVLVTDSFNFDTSQKLFRDPDRMPLIACSADSARRASKDFEGFDLLIAGETEIDFSVLKELLYKKGLKHVLCEGGPTLNTFLLDAGVIDELCLTITPKLIQGSGPRIFDGEGLEVPIDFHIDQMFFEEGQLFLRCSPDV